MKKNLKTWKMIKPKFIFLLLISSLFFLNLCNAQTNEDDLSELMDDGGISNRNKSIKLGLSNLFQGDLCLNYEQGLGDNFSIDVGVGKILPFHIYEFGNFIDILMKDPLTGKKRPIEGGFSFRISPKWFFSGSAPEYHNVGPKYRYRKYQFQSDSSFTVSSWTINYGYNYYLGNRFVFEISVGTGYRRGVLREKGVVKTQKEFNIHPIDFHYMAKIGIRI